MVRESLPRIPSVPSPPRVPIANQPTGGVVRRGIIPVKLQRLFCKFSEFGDQFQ